MISKLSRLPAVLQLVKGKSRTRRIHRIRIGRKRIIYSSKEVIKTMLKNASNDTKFKWIMHRTVTSAFKGTGNGITWSANICPDRFNTKWKIEKLEKKFKTYGKCPVCYSISTCTVQLRNVKIGTPSLPDLVCLKKLTIQLLKSSHSSSFPKKRSDHEDFDSKKTLATDL